MRTLCCPALSPCSGSRRLAGGVRMSSSLDAEDSIRSLRRDALARSFGKPFGIRSSHTAAVRLSANERIIRDMYHISGNRQVLWHRCRRPRSGERRPEQQPPPTSRTVSQVANGRRPPAAPARTRDLQFRGRRSARRRRIPRRQKKFAGSNLVLSPANDNGYFRTRPSS
jgi:hypothetical protein